MRASTIYPKHATEIVLRQIGAGVSVPIEVEIQGKKEVYLLAANTFKGINFSFGGSVLNENSKEVDDVFTDTANREFNEETYIHLISLHNKGALENQLGQWGFDSKERNAFIDAIEKLEQCSLTKKIANHVEAHKLAEKDLKLYKSASYFRAEYVANPVTGVTIDELNDYLHALTAVAKLITAKLDVHKKTTGKEGRDAARAVFEQYPGLDDITEASSFGIVPAKTVVGAIWLRQNPNETEKFGATQKTEKAWQSVYVDLLPEIGQKPDNNKSKSPGYVIGLRSTAVVIDQLAKVAGVEAEDIKSVPAAQESNTPTALVPYKTPAANDITAETALGTGAVPAEHGVQTNRPAKLFASATVLLAMLACIVAAGLTIGTKIFRS